MKKLFVLGLAVLSMAFATNANAQVQFGVKGGLNVVNMSFSGSVVDESNRAGFYLGPTVRIGLPLTGFSLDGSLLYDQRTAHVSYQTGTENVTLGDRSINQKQLAIPVNIRYSWGLGSVASIFVFGGPQIGLNLSDDIEDINFEWKNTNFSINLGVGARFLEHFEASVDYNIGCGHTGEVTVGKVLDATRSKSGAFQIGVAYYF